MKQRWTSLILAVMMLFTFGFPANASSIINLAEDSPSAQELSLPSQPQPSSDSEMLPAALPDNTEKEEILRQDESDEDTWSAPPDNVSFEAVQDSGGQMSVMAMGEDTVSVMSAGTTIYMKKIPDIVHAYPFSSATGTYNGFVFTTAEGIAAYCVEPARL